MPNRQPLCQRRIALPGGEARSHPGWLPSYALDVPPGAEPMSEGATFEDWGDVVARAISHTQDAIRKQREVSDAHPPMSAAPAEDPGGKLGKLAVLVCASRNALTDEVVNRAFPDGYASHHDIGDCESGARLFIIPTSYCARQVFKSICSQDGDPVYINRSVILDAARGFTAPPATIPPTNPGPTVTPVPPTLPLDDLGEKPDREPMDPEPRHSPHPPRPGSWNDR